MTKIKVSAPGARAKFEEWIEKRGGVRVWENCDLSNIDAGEMFTPNYLQELFLITWECPPISADVFLYPSPHWRVRAGEVVSDLSRFQFIINMEEIKRFHVAVRRGRQGLKVKCTDGSSRKIRAAVCRAEEKHGAGNIYYKFDYASQEAVIQRAIWEG